MQRIISLSLLTLAISACDSEGIDRENLGATPQTVITVDGSSNQSPGVSDDDTNVDSGSSAGDDGQGSTDGSSNTPTGGENDVNMFGGSGSSNGPTTGENDVNMFGGSGSSNGPTTNDDEVNMFGGSGSSNGPTVQDDDAGNNGDSATGSVGNFTTEAPTSGTTFVSTMSPIRSETGPLCLGPQTDALGNVIMNDRNCPQLQYHGQLKFGDFMLSTNAWNFCASSLPDWEQCVSVSDAGGDIKPRWDYDWGNESDVNGAVWLVKSYPEIIYGIKSPGEYSGTSLTDAKVQTGLPARVKDLPYYKIDYTFSSEEYPTRSKPFGNTILNGERNVAIESFFHELDADCSPESLIRNSSTSNQRYEIMVWLDSGAERLPAGPNDYVTTKTLDGVDYDIYTKPSDREYIAFVSKSPQPSGSINWTTFIEWTRDYAHRVNEEFGTGSNTVRLEDDWCLANILLGTEIWWGNGYFQADEWTIHRTER
jgi:hypothetical protein